VSGETHLRLIESAERLIAERGIHGVSLREIGAEAGQRNTGAVRYHFGSKAQLVNAVFEHRMTPINERRLALLSQLDAAGSGHEMRGLTEAFLYPLAESLGDVGRPSWYLRFCVQAAYEEGAAPTDLTAQPWTRGASLVQQRTRDLLSAAGVPESMLADRGNLVTGYMSHALADRELLIQYAPTRVQTPRPVFLAHLIDTAVALADAPVSEQTTLEIQDQHINNDRRSA
jgi:AcrR family transcriptional regulator